MTTTLEPPTDTVPTLESLPVPAAPPAWAHPPTSRRHLVDTDFGQVHVRVTGEAQEGVPPLLLLHQTPSSSKEWMRVAAELGDRQCIIPDLIGLGFSDPAPKAMTLDEHAWAVTQAASTLTGEWVAVGHHTGAVVATAVAGTATEQTLGLGIVGYPLYEGWRVRYERLSNCNAAHYDAAEVAAVWEKTASSYAEGTDTQVVLDAVTDKLLAGVVWYGTYVALWMSDLKAVLERAASGGRPATVLAPVGDSLSKFAPAVADVLGTTAVPVAGGSRILVDDPATVAAALAPLLEIRSL